MQPLTTMSADKTDTDVFPEHLPSGKNLYYKGPILQKTILVCWGGSPSYMVS